MLFRQIVFYALLVGILSGLILTVVQLWQVVPIIQNAERYENATVPVVVATIDGPTSEHAGHLHAAGEWSPEDGIERTGFTLLSNVLTATGMALLILFAIISSLQSNSSVSARLNWRHGLLWGAAGYAVFFLVPSLGVPPGIPGAVEVPLETRTIWWLTAVSCTSVGLALLAFTKSPWRWTGLGVLVVPYLIGAPSPPTASFMNHSPRVINELTTLANEFVSATAMANAAFWLVLGVAAVWAARRIVSPTNKSVFD